MIKTNKSSRYRKIKEVVSVEHGSLRQQYESFRRLGISILFIQPTMN